MGIGFAESVEDTNIPLIVPAGELLPDQRAFLTAFADCHTVRGAVRRSKIHHLYHYEWLAEDAQYQAAYARIKAMISGLGVESIEQRALKGVPKKLTYQGIPTGHTIREYSDTLQVQYLKANDPRYRDGGINVNIGPQSLAITYPNSLTNEGNEPDKPKKITQQSHNSFDTKIDDTSD